MENLILHWAGCRLESPPYGIITSLRSLVLLLAFSLINLVAGCTDDDASSASVAPPVAVATANSGPPPGESTPAQEHFPDRLAREEDTPDEPVVAQDDESADRAVAQIGA